jgi:peptidyl-prolyl cis-trans isomerase SurA
MLNAHGVDMTTLYNQFEGDIAWARVVREDLRHNVVVAPEEVKTVMNRLKANQGKPESEVSEIFLPIAPGARDADVRQVAERLVQQARSGTPFAALAQQFSQSPTAAVGGDLGWVLKGDLEDEVDAALANMEPGEISEPIRTASGYHIIQLKARRSSGAADPLMAIVTLSQIYLPTVGGRAPSPQRLAQLSDAISTDVSSCRQMNSWAKQIGGPGSGPVPEMRIGGFPAPVRDGILHLATGRVSPAINLPGAKLFVMVCKRQEDTGLPTEEQVEEKLENDKLESAARQRLRDLRRQAIIDVRI